MFRLKTKKIKGNAILSAFIFTISLFILCAFGTDTAYIILARYKLQKITEAIAIEYCSLRARDHNNTIEPPERLDDVCKKTRGKYERIYKTPGAGLLGFNIENIEYKANRQDDIIVVKVETTSRIIPTFLRFVGARTIIIHSNACAKREKIRISKEIKADSNFFLYEDVQESLNNIEASGEYANAEATMVTFSAPFIDDNNERLTASEIVARNTGNGDFSIEFEYAPRGDWWPPEVADLDDKDGGFHILASYGEISPNSRWVDIGSFASTNPSNFTLLAKPNTSDEDGLSIACINAPHDLEPNGILFDLTNRRHEHRINYPGKIQRIQHLRIYKAVGISENGNNPCDPVYSSQSGPYNPAKFFNRPATVTLTILNDVKLISNSDYRNFVPVRTGIDTDDFGTCRP